MNALVTTTTSAYAALTITAVCIWIAYTVWTNQKGPRP